MENNYKLIAIDLDGTLLTEEKIITEKNKKAIKKCIDNGIKIVISSGRALEHITNYMDELEIKDGYGSAFHGSTIFKSGTNEIVNETFLENKLAKEIVNDLLSCEEIGLLVFTRDKIYSNDVNEYVKQYSRNRIVNITIFSNVEEIQGEISKVLLKGDRERLELLRDQFNDYGDRCKVLFSELDLLEFMSLETNKGFSLEKIAGYFGIDIKDTIAIGDNHNDIEMIEKAGIGVAVYNAVDELKKRADYITVNDNEKDAISEVIEKFIKF